MTENTRENRTWNGVTIPPVSITPCGRLTDTPEKFYVSACQEVDRLLSNIGLGESSSILDVGCGVGRLPIGLLSRRAPFAFYLGVDVDKDRIGWCVENIAPQDSRLHFQFTDIRNARYNPNGRTPINLALPPSSIDVVYFYSVFSHLVEEDARAYLSLTAEVLRPSGAAFATAFVADDVPPITENPDWYGPLEWVGPLHCVLYDRLHWYSLVAAAGLEIVREVPMVNADQQTGYVMVRRRRRIQVAT